MVILWRNRSFFFENLTATVYVLNEPAEDSVPFLSSRRERKREEREITRREIDTKLEDDGPPIFF